MYKGYKVGDKIKRKDGSIRVITLYDLLAALGAADLANKVDTKSWKKFDKFFHGFLVAARLVKNAAGKKLLKELNIEVGNGKLNMDAILENYKQLNKEAA